MQDLTFEIGAAVDAFIAAATDGRADRAAGLLALYPRVAGAGFHVALLLGDAAAYAEVARLLLDAGSPLDWDPGDEPDAGILEILAQWRRNPSPRPDNAVNSPADARG